ncbi:fimbrial biogenesis chaperone [Deinococcus pimensis]|uniref:fimbrial biogenesis chaperone n=1 Tax=Deinococcus pimensis TaxID=309888 RepID=UPI000482147E|nr:fimbria/pilus periplasmic chaperone [Deinococcus pimensis]
MSLFNVPTLTRTLIRATLAALLLGTADAATSLQFSPTSLQLRGSQTSTLVTIRNVSTQTATFSTELLRWRQDGQDQYAATRDFIVNPARFTLAPGQEQTVRLARRGAPTTEERAYRLYVQELPATATGESAEGTVAQVTTLYRVGLPLFVTLGTPNVGTTEVTFTVDPTSDGQRVTVRNTNNRYTLVRDLQFTLGEVRTAPTAFNLLAGGALTFTLPNVPGVRTADVSAKVGASDETRRLTIELRP